MLLLLFINFSFAAMRNGLLQKYLNILTLLKLASLINHLLGQRDLNNELDRAQLSIYRCLIHVSLVSPAMAQPILIHCDVGISPDAQMSRPDAIF